MINSVYQKNCVYQLINSVYLRKTQFIREKQSFSVDKHGLSTDKLSFSDKQSLSTDKHSFSDKQLFNFPQERALTPTSV